MPKAFIKFVVCATLCFTTLRLWATPANDQFANAIDLPPVVLGLRTDYSGEGATLESWEINQLNPTDGIGTVWWRWTPTISAPAEVESFGSDLWIYRRNSMNELTIVAFIRRGPPDLHPLAGQGFVCEAGVTYWIRAASTWPGSWWRIGQRLQGLQIGSPSVGNSASFVFTNSFSQPAPISLQMEIFMRPPLSFGWARLVTNVVTPVAFGTVWDWVAPEEGQYMIRTTASFESGEIWSRVFELRVRSENDDFDDATEIPPALEEGTITYRSQYSTSEEGEPPYPKDPGRGVWWRWSPNATKSVRIRAAGLPVEVFTGAALNNLTRVAHNDGRTGTAEGWTALNATVGETYFIRLSGMAYLPFSVPGTLEMTPMSTPMRGWVRLSNHSGTAILGRIVEPDGTPTVRPALAAAFYLGTSLTNLYSGSPRLVGRGLTIGEVEIPGTLSHGATETPVPAGEQLYVQIRLWDDATHYEAARALRRMVGKSRLMKVTAGSEFTGPAILSEIGDITLFSVTNFVPGRFELENRAEQSWRVTGFPGTYLIQAGNLAGEWTTVETFEMWSGSAVFRDARAEKPATFFYRARLVD